ncbi:DNA-binding CsgD family transcriptional regulator [Porphyrobacter sp. MBR-155]|jgi:DNA-binding CsgD family transcriptional regulator|uniref:helix-turn-helix transcriptional regulator n=1 Tax=Porphyrobacter sp. MBR-155 TaxID=3156464 RepID=UPI003394CFA3
MANNVLDLCRLDKAAQAGSPPDDMAISTQIDIAIAAQFLAHKVRRHGLRLIVWHNLATLEPMIDSAGDPLNLTVFGWDEETLAPWLCHEAAVCSPLIKACRVANEPLWINRHGAFPKGQNRFVEKIDYTGFERYVSANAAIIMPVRMPFGYLAAAFLTSVDPGQHDLSEEFESFGRTLVRPIDQFLRRYSMLTFDDRYLPSDNLLSSREIECLNWIAQGKTDYEISVILGCSHAGVRYHITRVSAKLGAVNRAQSVFKACQLGYLGIPSRRLPHSCAQSVNAGRQKVCDLPGRNDIHQRSVENISQRE